MTSRHRSIIVPIVALVFGGALLAVAVQFALMFRGPPPGSMPPLPVSRIAEALRTGTLPPGRERQITIRRVEAEPTGRSIERPDLRRDAVLAARIGVPVDQVRGYYQMQARDPENDLFGSWTIASRRTDGWVVASSPERPAFTHWHLIRLIATLGTLIVLTMLAWLVARKISGPLRDLADVASRARLGTKETVPITGPREVRELASAMAAMQRRILEQAEGRATMLAAIAHDLGTPLSRIAFWIEQLPDPARVRASADLDQMRDMLAAALRFTRDGASIERAERLDLGSLLESLVDDLCVAGTPVSAQPGPRLVIRGHSIDLKRLFANLVENAVRYGVRAELQWRINGRWAEVIVDDEGPGFDAENSESLFQPFVRGEASRNRDTGGTGLGLAIVRSITESHGGEVTLETRPLGGGRVRVWLPMA